MELLKALDVLSTSSLKTESESDRQHKLKQLRTVDEQMSLPSLQATADFLRLLSFTLHTLLRVLGDSDMNVWSLAEEVLNKVIKSLLKTHHDWIVVELFKGLKSQHFTSRALRVSLGLFARVISWTSRAKLKKLAAAVPKVVAHWLGPCANAQTEVDTLLVEALATHFEEIVRTLAPYLTDSLALTLLSHFLPTLHHPHSSVRRSGASLIVSLCRHFPTPVTVAHILQTLHPYLPAAISAFPPSSALASSMSSPERSEPKEPLSEVSAASSTLSPRPQVSPSGNLTLTLSPYTLQGVLHCYLRLLKLSKEFGSHNAHVMNSLLSDLSAVADFALNTLAHADHNVTVTALELLQELCAWAWPEITRLWGVSITRNRMTALLAQFERLLWNDTRGRVSSQVLVMMCLAQLCRHSAEWCVLEDIEAPPLQPLHQWLTAKYSALWDLLHHSDPLLRGQTAYFFGCWLHAHLTSLPPSVPYLFASSLFGGCLEVPRLIDLLLDMCLYDTQSVAAKLACQALALCLMPLAHSPWGLYALYILQSLLTLSPSAYLLVKIKVLSLFAKVDFHVLRVLESKLLQVIDEESLHATATSKANAQDISFGFGSVPPMRPARLTSGTDYQQRLVDMTLSLLADADHRVRTQAAKTLVKFLPHLSLGSALVSHTSPLLSLLSVLAPSKVSLGKEQVNWVVWCVLPRIHERGDNSLKGFSEFLAVLTERGYHLPSQLIPLVFEYLTSTLVATHLETQLNVLATMEHVLVSLRNEAASYSMKIFVHVLRVMNILSTIVMQHKTTPALREIKSVALDSSGGGISKEALYQILLERLKDTYRLSLASLTPSLFDQLRYRALCLLRRCVEVMGKDVLPYCEEILGYLLVHFDEQTAEVVHCVQQLLLCAVGPNEGTTDSPSSSSLSADTTLREGNATERRTPMSSSDEGTFADYRREPPQRGDVVSHFLYDVARVLLPSATTSSLRDRMIESVIDNAVLFSDENASKVMVSAQSRQPLFRHFEPLVSAAISKYVDTSSMIVKSRILHLLIVAMRFGLDFWSLDKEQKLIRELIAEVDEALSSMHLSDHKGNGNELTAVASAGAAESPAKSTLLRSPSLATNVTVHYCCWQVVSQVAFLQALWLLFSHPSKQHTVLQNMQILSNLIRQHSTLKTDSSHVTSSPSTANSSLTHGSSTQLSPPEKASGKVSLPVLPSVTASAIEPKSKVEQIGLIEFLQHYLQSAYRLVAVALEWCDVPESCAPTLRLSLPPLLRNVFNTEASGVHSAELRATFYDHLLVSVQQRPDASTLRLVADVLALSSSPSIRLLYVNKFIRVLKELLMHHEDVFTACTAIDRQQLYAVLAFVSPECTESKDFLAVFFQMNLLRRLRTSSSPQLLSSGTSGHALVDHTKERNESPPRIAKRGWIIVVLICLRLLRLFHLENIVRGSGTLAPYLSSILLCCAEWFQYHPREIEWKELLIEYLYEVQRYWIPLSVSSERDVPADTFVAHFADELQRTVQHADYALLATASLLWVALFHHCRLFEPLFKLWLYAQQGSWSCSQEMLRLMTTNALCTFSSMVQQRTVLLHTPPFLRLLTEYVTETAVCEFLGACRSDAEYEVILAYIRTELTTRSPLVVCTSTVVAHYHRLFLLFSQLPSKAASLQVLPLFMRSSALSVHAAVERYLLHKLNEFHLNTSTDELSDRTIKHFIHSHRSLFRASFLQRLGKVHWLQLEPEGFTSTVGNSQLAADGACHSHNATQTADGSGVQEQNCATCVEFAISSCGRFDFLRLFDKYFPMKLPEKVKISHMSAVLCNVMRADAKTFGALLHHPHVSLNVVLPCFSDVHADLGKRQLLTYLHEKIIRLSTSETVGDLLVWQQDEEILPVVRALTLALERWGVDVPLAFTSAPGSLDTALNMLLSFVLRLLRGCLLLPGHTLFILLFLRLLTAIVRSLPYSIDAHLNVQRLTNIFTFAPTSTLTPTPTLTLPSPLSSQTSVATTLMSEHLRMLVMSLYELYYAVFNPPVQKFVWMAEGKVQSVHQNISKDDVHTVLAFFWQLLRSPPQCVTQFASFSAAFLALLTEFAAKFDVSHFDSSNDFVSSQTESTKQSVLPVPSTDTTATKTAKDESGSDVERLNVVTKSSDSKSESSASSYSLSTSKNFRSDSPLLATVSLEQCLPYPFQTQPINFDNNDDPNLVVRHFLRLVNTVRINHPRVFHRVWNQLYEVAAMHNDTQPHRELLTPQTLKSLAVQALTSLLLQIGHLCTSGNHLHCVDVWQQPLSQSQFKSQSPSPPQSQTQGPSLTVSTGEQQQRQRHPLLSMSPESLLDMSLGSLRLRDIFPLSRIPLAQIREFRTYQWGDVELSVYIEELLIVFKAHIDQYESGARHTHLLVKEIAKAILFLSDFFTRAQYVWMRDTFQRLYTATSSSSSSFRYHPLMNDLLLDQYLLIGLFKAEVVLVEKPSVASVPPNTTPLIVLSQETHRKIVQTFVAASSAMAPSNNTNRDLSPNAAEFVVSAPRHWNLRLAILHAVWYLLTGLSLLQLPLTSLAPPLVTALEAIVSDSKDSLDRTLDNLIAHRDLQLSHLILQYIRHTFSTIVTELTTKKGLTKSHKKSAPSTSEHLVSGIEPEQEMQHMEQVKNLFYKIRQVSTRPGSDDDTEIIATHILPDLLLQYFSHRVDQIMSLVLGEFSKPDQTTKSRIAHNSRPSSPPPNLSLADKMAVTSSSNDAMNISLNSSNIVSDLTIGVAVRRSALVLFKVFRRLHTVGSDDVHRTMKKWIVMCLSNFVQLSRMNTTTTFTASSAYSQHYWQALWSLTIVFLTASPDPLLYSFFYVLIARDTYKITSELFACAAFDFYERLDVDAKTAFINSLREFDTEPYRSLCVHLSASRNKKHQKPSERRQGSGFSKSVDNPQRKREKTSTHTRSQSHPLPHAKTFDTASLLTRNELRAKPAKQTSSPSTITANTQKLEQTNTFSQADDTQPSLEAITNTSDVVSLQTTPPL